MKETERRPIPDGRIRIARLFNEKEKQSLMQLKIEGLIMLNRTEVDFTPPETWIGYWFDEDMVSESSVRFQIQEAISNSRSK